MSGTWSTTSPPSRPGAYFNFVTAAQAAVSGGVGGVTAIIGTADWGPANTVTSVTSQAEYESLFSSSTGGTLPVGVVGALDGFDIGGASTVLVYRGVASAGAQATRALTDGSTTALTLTAKYKGTRANNWTVSVLANGSDKDIVLYESGVELERWTIPSGFNDDAETVINESDSPYVTAADTGAANRVVQGTDLAFTGGNSGTTLAAPDDWTAAFTALENQTFNTVALCSGDDDTVRDLFAAWVDTANSAGQRCIGVVGEDTSDTLDGAGVNALDRSIAYDSANVVNIGPTNLRRLTDSTVFGGAQLAPRIAGAIANVGLTRSMTFLKLSGYQVDNPLSSADYVNATAGGVLTFTNDNNSRIRVEQGVTSLRTTSELVPEAFKTLRNVSIAQYIENTLTFVATENYIGVVPNTDTARRDLVGNFLAFLKSLEQSNVLAPGSTVELDPTYVQDGNAVFIRFSVQFIDAIERVFVSVRLG